MAGCVGLHELIRFYSGGDEEFQVSMAAYLLGDELMFNRQKSVLKTLTENSREKFFCAAWQGCISIKSTVASYILLAKASKILETQNSSSDRSRRLVTSVTLTCCVFALILLPFLTTPLTWPPQSALY